jgi:ABC-type tungstate transport system substrate-binding protein
MAGVAQNQAGFGHVLVEVGDACLVACNVKVMAHVLLTAIRVADEKLRSRRAAAIVGAVDVRWARGVNFAARISTPGLSADQSRDRWQRACRR